jgi:5'-nucleotidase
MSLVIAISTRCLFDLDESHEVFLNEGADAFNLHQLEHRDQILGEGVAFGLVRKLLKLKGAVKFVILSSNTPEAGIRVMQSVVHYGLPITQAYFTGGGEKFKFLPILGAHLYLSTDEREVTKALNAGYAAARVSGSNGSSGKGKSPRATSGSGLAPIKIAFDFDRVLCDGISDEFWVKNGMERYKQHELELAEVPLGAGPLKVVMERLVAIRQQFPSQIRLGIFTARGEPANLRVLTTLRQWQITVDELFFLDGKPKGTPLATWGADIFFDDSLKNVTSAIENNVLGVHVA